MELDHAFPISPFGMEFTYEPAPRCPTMREICDEVAAAHGVTMSDLRSDRRFHKIILARHEAMYRCRHETLATMGAIGRFLGGKDHTTVMNAVRRHGERLAAAGRLS